MSKKEIKSKTRLNLAISNDTKERLNRLCQNTEIESITEAIKLSTWLLEEYIKTREEQGRFLVQSKDNDTLVELRLPL